MIDVCSHCDEEIRLDDDGRWMDRETGHSCASGDNIDKPHEVKSPSIVARITLAVRDADENFQKSGGSSRHWVVECFLPAMNKAGLHVISDRALDRLLDVR